VRHKKHTQFFYHNLKKGYPILIIFATHIHDTTGHQMAVQLSTSPNICLCTTWGKQNKQNIAFLFNAIKVKRLKVHIALNDPISELWSVTCHMGSHSVTCHPTEVNAPHLNPSQIGRYSIYLPRRDGRLS